MNLAEMLVRTGDSHARLDTGAVTVNLTAEEADYWHLSDYAVSSRAGMMLVMVPRNVTTDSHADNGWQYHFGGAR
jgi:hypothetical protein